jgi:hypothetical protein
MVCSTEAVSGVIVALVERVRRHCDLLFALAVTFVFYWPAIRHGSRNAGFLYTGDVLGAYVPLLAKTRHLFSHHRFTALDYSSFNGSSDFFLSPSSHSFHPVVVIHSLLSRADAGDLHETMRLLVMLLAISSFLACYYTIRLCRTYLRMDFGLAALVGVLYAFSTYMAASLNQPSFQLSATPLPWCVYTALRYAERPTLRRLLWGALPIVFCLLGSYVPLGVACIGLAALLVLCLSLANQDGGDVQERVRSVVRATGPFLCAAAVVGPYLLAVFSFYRETPGSHSPSLFFSAHQLAELPQGFLRIVSHRFHVNGPLVEFSVVWGLPTLVVVCAFLFSRRTRDGLSAWDWTMLRVCAAIYFLVVLAIYGEHSVLSDMIFYFVPQIGTMHIYQRFLLPAHFLLAVATAIMLRAVVDARPTGVITCLGGLLGVGTLAAAGMLSSAPAAAAGAGISNYLVFELLAGTLMCAALLMPGAGFVYACAIVLMALTPFDQMYDACHGKNEFADQKLLKPCALDPAVRERIVGFMRRNTTKEVTRFVDCTPLWTRPPSVQETFPKGFSMITAAEAPLCSYGGFMFYLGGRKDYIAHMPVGADVAVQPDWEYVLETGADFAVARDADIAGSAFLRGVAARARDGDVLAAPGGVKILSLRDEVRSRLGDGKVVFDNGYFRIGAVDTGHGLVVENVALGGTAVQSRTFGAATADRAIDGDSGGVLDAGKTSSTDRDVHAWLDIDLGREYDLDRIRIWNRTDGSQDRLRDFWVFVSEQPFQPTDTAAALATRGGVWSRQVYTIPMPSVEVPARRARGRYVRVQLDGSRPADQSYLTLAEVEVLAATDSGFAVAEPPSQGDLVVNVSRFHTNAANACGIEFESSGPATVQYLFGGNPRLTVTLNGRRVMPVEHNGVWAIQTPAGTNRIEMRYHHRLLDAFWVLYGLYAAALVAVCVLPDGTARRT